MIAEAILSLVLSAGPNKMPDSTYTGPWYVPEAEPFRKCVMSRESGGNYKSDSQYGSGAYAFIQSTWDHYSQLAGHAEYVGVRPYKAPVYVQDAVFWRTFWKGKGRHHWSAIHAETIGKKIKQCT